MTVCVCGAVQIVVQPAVAVNAGLDCLVGVRAVCSIAGLVSGAVARVVRLVECLVDLGDIEIGVENRGAIGRIACLVARAVAGARLVEAGAVEAAIEAGIASGRSAVAGCAVAFIDNIPRTGINAAGG